MKKKGLFLGVFLVILGGGGFGGYKFMAAKDATAAIDETGESHGETATADEHTASSEGEHGGILDQGPVFMSMNGFMLPVVSSQGVEQFVMISLSLEVEDMNTKAELVQMEPRLRDAIFRSLYSVFASGRAFNGHTVNVDIVKQRSMAAIRAVTEEELVQEVLVQRVAQRPI